MDIGLLLLRVVVGLLFVGHGAQKLFGWFGGHGIEGTGGFVESLGYRPSKPMAAIAGMSELGGGLLLVVGFLTPLGAAAIIGMMLNATLSVHLEKGLWNTEGGFELPLVYATAALALAFVGAGTYSADRALGWDLAGVPWGLGALTLGVLVGSATIAMRRTDPVEEEEEAPAAMQERRVA